ncbi:MAG: hypothetical protein ACFB0B_07225 [Thermonemataceae bacterium]
MKYTYTYLFTTILCICLIGCGDVKEEKTIQEIQEERAEEEESDDKATTEVEKSDEKRQVDIPKAQLITAKGVGMLSIGMSVDAMKETLGETYTIEEGVFPPVPGDVFDDNYKVSKEGKTIMGVFVSTEDNDKIVGFRVYAPSYKTSKGIHVGMSLAKVKEIAPRLMITSAIGSTQEYLQDGRINYVVKPDIGNDPLGEYESTDAHPMPTNDYSTNGTVQAIEIM